MSIYEKYSIYELRNIARQLGVKSPTTKKHAQLVAEIEEKKQSNEIVITSKKGRPSKEFFMLKEVVVQNQNIPNDCVLVKKNDINSIIKDIEELLNNLKNHI